MLGHFRANTGSSTSDAASDASTVFNKFVFQFYFCLRSIGSLCKKCINNKEMKQVRLKVIKVFLRRRVIFSSYGFQNKYTTLLFDRFHYLI